MYVKSVVLLNINCTVSSVISVIERSGQYGRKFNVDAVSANKASRRDARAKMGKLVGGNPQVPPREGEEAKAPLKARRADKGEHPNRTGNPGDRPESEPRYCAQAWHKTLTRAEQAGPFVIDANIMAAALLKDSKTRELLLGCSFQLFAPDFLSEELGKYSCYFAEKLGKTGEEVKSALEELFERAKIVQVPRTECEAFLPFGIDASPDLKDALYFALALKLGIPIWTNDKKLKKQEVVEIISTQDILQGNYCVPEGRYS